MPINFDALPSNNPNGLIPKATYFATIEKAEMKQGKDTAKPPYLNLQLALMTNNGEPVGKLFDMLFDATHEVVKYKLKRFIQALKLPLTGSFELKDLTKICVGKKLIVDVTIDEKQTPPKSVVDVFSNEVYYPLEDASKLWGMSIILDEVNATDALDHIPEPTESQEY